MKQKILFIACLLFALMYINAGLNKFFNYMPMPTDMPESMKSVMAAFMQIKWLMPLVGVVEVIGGILLISPQFRALGAIIVLPISIGILLTNIINAPSGLPIAVVLFTINLWAIIENKEKYYPMLKR